MEGNADLVEALATFNSGRGLASFIDKNKNVLCKHTLNQNRMLAEFNANETIIKNVMHPPSDYDKNMELYHHIQRIDDPRKYVDALEETDNDHVLETIRKILKPPQQISGAGENPGGSGNKTANESQVVSSGGSNEENEQNQPLPSPSLSSASSGRSNDDEKLFPEKAESYDCENVRVLFINQKFDSPGKFQNAEYRKNKRDGADADRQHVENLFKKTLKMEVQVEPNVDSEDFPVVLKRFKRKCTDEGNDGCIIIMSTHGADPHFLLMDDLELINLEKDVIQQFGREKFPDFDGKPKIFLVNACRSEIVQDDSSPQRGSLEYADILIGRSTVPYHASHRDTQVGSHYIKFLHDVYMENPGQKWEIRNLLETVGAKVGEVLDSQNRVQICEVTSRLFPKNFYLTKNQK